MSHASDQESAPLDSETNEPSGVKDDRRPSWGLGRIVMAIFWIFGLLTTVPAVIDLIRDVNSPIGPRLVAVLAGAIYLVIAVGITHNGRKMRLISWAAMIAAFVGPYIMGLFELGVEPVSEVSSAWSHFGAQYWYVPLVLPLVGFVWMWRSNPRRIVVIAEGIDRPSRFPWHDG